MKTLAVRIGYYRTSLIEVTSKGRELRITKVAHVNCGKNFMIGRYNKLDEYADKLSIKMKAEFKGSMNNAILVLPNDMCIDTLVDAIDMESKNKLKEIRKEIIKERHVGLSGLDIIRVGANTYNDMYLVTEYDSKRLEILLDSLYKRTISFKQIVGPLFASHHLARTVVCPFEMVGKGNSSSMVKAGTLIVNISINRLTYIFTHNNLPIELRESSHTLMPFIEKMGKQGIPFTKVTRILGLIGVDGIDDDVSLGFAGQLGLDEAKATEFQVLDSLDSIDEQGMSEMEDPGETDKPDKSEQNYVIEDDNLTSSNKKQSKIGQGIGILAKSLKDLNSEIDEEDRIEDEDISLTDQQYQAFEQGLLEELVSIRSETQKNITYFSSNHGVKIANVIVTSNDINGLGYKIEDYLDVGAGTMKLMPEGIIEIDDYTISNQTGSVLGSEYSLGLGAILSNFVRGDIYE